MVKKRSRKKTTSRKKAAPAASKNLVAVLLVLLLFVSVLGTWISLNLSPSYQSGTTQVGEVTLTFQQVAGSATSPVRDEVQAGNLELTLIKGGK
jgi:hypothetical protein